MIFRSSRIAAATAILFVTATFTAAAQPTSGATLQAVGAGSLPFVSPLFSDNMALQRSKADAIWDGPSLAIQPALWSAKQPQRRSQTPIIPGMSRSNLLRPADLTP